MAALIESDELVSDVAELDRQASQHYRSGEYDLAIEVLRKVYGYRLEILGSEHEDVLLNLNNLGAALGRNGLLKEAEEAFRDAMHGRQKLKGLDHGDTLTSIGHLGTLLKQFGPARLDEAELLLYKALKGFQTLHGKKHIASAEVAFPYAILAVQQGKRTKAAYLFALAAIGLEAVLGSDHPHTKYTIEWAEKCAKSVNHHTIRMDTGDGPLLTSSELKSLDLNIGIFVSKSSWQTASSCERCMIQFTMMRREHHCRICGLSVCNDCSTGSTTSLEFDQKKKVRVCGPCEAQGFS